MSVASDAVRLIKDVLKLTDDVQRAGTALHDIAHELREHDRRITRLEAQWTTALQIAALQRSPVLPRGQ
jgi:hypothetical protein